MYIISEVGPLYQGDLCEVMKISKIASLYLLKAYQVIGDTVRNTGKLHDYFSFHL